jgi:plastocyanin
VGSRRNWGRISRSFIPAIVIALFVVGITAATATDSAAKSALATVNVALGDNTFTPAQVTVNVGDTVVWTNTGRNPHDVTSDNGSFFSQRNMMNGQTYSFTTTTVGTFNYQCTIHNGMVGVLTVLGAAPGAAPRTGGGGMAGAVMQQWQQLAALAVVIVGGSALLAVRRLRRAEQS